MNLIEAIPAIPDHRHLTHRKFSKIKRSCSFLPS